MSNQTDAGRYINKISNRLRRQSKRAQEQLGLTTAQSNILSYILLEGTDTRLYQKDVEKEFDLRPSTATELLRTLEKKELICRISDEQDGRYKILRATSKAENIREALREEIREMEERLVKGIPEPELELFKKTAEKMLENLEE